MAHDASDADPVARVVSRSSAPGPAASAPACQAARAGPRRLRDPGEGAGHRRHLVPQPLPGRRVRHQVAPLLLLVRPQPRVVAPVRPPARDQGVPRGRRRPLRARARTCASATAVHVDALGRRRRRSGASPCGDEAEVVDADVVVSAIGMFGEPVAPDIPGLDRFAGTMFHSADWDDDHDLTGERVAVIGSAASAVQLDPRDRADRRVSSTVYQRSANWVLAEGGRPVLRRGARDVRRATPTRSRASRDEIFATIDPNLTFADTERRALAEAVGRRNIDAGRGRRGADAAHARTCRSGASGRWRRTSTTPRSTCPRRAGDRADHRGHRARGSSPPTARPARSTRSSSPPASPPPSSSPRSTSSGRDGVDIDDAWADGAPGVPRHHHQRVPEPVHALRPEHQQRVDHLHDRVPGRLRDADARRAWTTTTSRGST